MSAVHTEESVFTITENNGQPAPSVVGPTHRKVKVSETNNNQTEGQDNVERLSK